MLPHRQPLLRGLAVASMATCAAVTVFAQETAPRPLSESERIAHVLNRFSLGPTPELVNEVRRKGITKWLDDQIEGRAGGDTDLTSRLRQLESIWLTNREVVDRYAKRPQPDETQKERRERQRLRNVPRAELLESVLLLAIEDRNQVRQVAADIFRNHFCVSVDKGRVRYFATEYEREVIRRGVFGTFGEMLSASAHHPAMLVYLDNVVSRRAPTKAELKKIEMRTRARTDSKELGEEASDIAAQRGLNENYARELLELHTLGVDNYYTQRDVEHVARALTGWTVENDRTKPLTFRFRPEMHSNGDKRLLRSSIKENQKDPHAEGERVLALLEAHPGTARFLAWKLCKHLVTDDPSDELVARIAKVFEKSDGDLPTVYRAIVRDPEFFERRHYKAKFKRPFEFAVSALRVTGADVKHTRGIQRALTSMNEALYACKDPTGYYDQAEAWRDAGAMAVRWKFAMDLSRGRVPGVTLPRELYAGLSEETPELWKDQLLFRLLPDAPEPRTSRVLDRMVGAYLAKKPKPKVQELAPYIVGSILGSPEFQKQ